jgi:hypothetical protein
MIRVFIQNNTLTTGKGLTGLVYNSTNLQITVIRELSATPTIYTGANIEDITTIGTYQAPSTSAKCRFKAIDGTNRSGEYEIHFHDDAGHFGAGDASKNVQIRVDEITTTALNIAPCLREIDLVAYDEQDAVALGLSLVPAQVKGWDDINLTAKMKSDVNAECDTANNDYGANKIAPNTVIPDPAGTAASLHATTDGKIDNIEAELETKRFPDGCVYLNTTSGITGTDYPKGEATNPVNNIPDGFTIAKNNKLGKIKLLAGGGFITLSESLVNTYYMLVEGVDNIGGGIIFNGYSGGDFTVWKNLYLTGDCTPNLSGLSAEKCDVIDLDCAGIIATECYLDNAINVIADNPVVYLTRCKTGGTVVTLTLTTGVGTNALVVITGFDGNLSLAGLIAGDTVFLEGTGLITISGTGGTVDLFGSINFVNNGTGITVNDNRGIIPKIDNVETEIEAKRFPDGCVYLNTASGITGTDYPKGEATNPVDNPTDAIAIAIANKLSIIKANGSFILSTDLTVNDYNIRIIGNDKYASTYVTLSDSGNAIFENCYIDGSTDSFLAGAINCIISLSSCAGGLFFDCYFLGSIHWTDDAYLYNATTLAAITTSFYIAANPMHLYIYNLSGGLTLKDGNTVEVNITVHNGAIVTLDATCIGGIYRITGIGEVINNGGVGITLIDNTVDAKLAVAQADLDNPDQYKADVSGLATEANLNTVKGFVDTEVQAILDAVGNVTYGLNALLAAINTRLATTGYTAPNNTAITDIQSKVNSELYGLAALLDAIGEIEGGATPEDIDLQLTSTHGSGSWASGVASAPYIIHIDTSITDYDENIKEIKIYTGTTPEINVIVTKNNKAINIFGKVVYLIVKKTEKTLTSNAIINKVGTIYDTENIDTAGDTIYGARFNLTLEETNALKGLEGKYKGQVDIGPDESVSPKFDVIIERKLRQDDD